MVQKIYPYLPVFAQNLAISIYGLYWKKRRLGGIFNEELIKFKERENFSFQQWRDYQTVELRKLLVHAFETVPFYRKKYKKYGFSRSDFEKFELEDLPKLPFLEKEDLRKFGKTELLSKRVKNHIHFFSSSGSTGTPVEIFRSPQMHQKWSAGFEARIRHWAGVDINTPRGMIGGRRVVARGKATPPFYRYNFFEKQTYFSAYHVSLSTAENYVEGMIRNNVKYMTGYAVSNYILARFIDELKLNRPKLKSVITSSEKLTIEMRNMFEKVYGCKTYDSYSGVEACGLISECECGGLHISPDLGIFEHVAQSNWVDAASNTEVACTGLLNYDQPLIRYRIGDDILFESNYSCQCGRNMPLVKEIIGRVEDVVIGKDGREMVRFHGIFIKIPKIVEGQIIQHDLDQFEVVLVVTKPLTDIEKRIILKRMESQLGKIKLKFSYVSRIPRNSNGKFRAVVSYVTRR